MAVERSSLGQTAQPVSRTVGIAALAAARAADVALTMPVLAAAPAAELNPLARALGPTAYLLANVVAVGVLVALIEGAISLDRRRHGRRSWLRDVAVRGFAYGWLVACSLLIAIHNAVQIKGVV
jgi:uncharacterized membrane protein